MANDMSKMMNNKLHIEDTHLPPISSRRPSKIGTSDRLQKIGM